MAIVIVVLPTPPLRLITTIRREPWMGAVTRASTAARLRSSAVGPGLIAPDVAEYTNRRQPPSGAGPRSGPRIASSVKAAAVRSAGSGAGMVASLVAGRERRAARAERARRSGGSADTI